MKDIIVGMGEVGSTLYQLLKKRGFRVHGVDIDQNKSKELPTDEIYFLHICFPNNVDFIEHVHHYIKLNDPKVVVIHSTVQPGTTQAIQKNYKIPIICAPTRGVHKRFLSDMERYTKFYGYDKKYDFDDLDTAIKKRFQKIRKMTNAITCELAKIVTDTTYYGWMIAYAYSSKMISDKHQVDYDEMWLFAEEPHEFLGNRPKFYTDPKGIGGHCVLPNLELFGDSDYEKLIIETIKQINSIFLKKSIDNEN